MRHPNNDVSHTTVCTHLEQLMEETHHTLRSFTTIPLHCGKLRGQEVIKLLLKTGELRY